MPTPDSINQNVLTFWQMSNITMSNGATSTDTTVMKSCIGTVAFLGNVTTSGQLIGNTVFATLPEGFRPKNEMIFQVCGLSNTNAHLTRIMHIRPNGEMFVTAGTNGTIYLDGFSFSILDATYGV